MEHTKGKIEVSSSNPNYTYVLKDGKANGLFAECDAGNYARSKEEGEANAKELVRRWNAFEEGGIVEELKIACDVGLDAINALLKMDIKFNTKNKKSLNEIIEFVEAALAKS